jgi:hypothetical protein
LHGAYVGLSLFFIIAENARCDAALMDVRVLRPGHIRKGQTELQWLSDSD